MNWLARIREARRQRKAYEAMWLFLAQQHRDAA